MKRILAHTWTAVFLFLLPAVAFAADTAAGDSTGQKGLIALGAGIGIAIASLGGALGQGRLASSALEGISRNPAASGSMFVPFILGIAFVESLVLFSFVVTILLQAKV